MHNPIKVVYILDGKSREEKFQPIEFLHRDRDYIDDYSAWQNAVHYATALREKGGDRIKDVRLIYEL